MKMEIEKIISLYNDENKNLDEIGKIIGKSKSTIQRFIKNNNYCLNKNTGKYETNVSHETDIIKGQEKFLFNETNVSRETIKMVNRTYAISEDIDRAIRIKAAVEDKKPIDVVREALESYIEQKYLDFK